MIQYWNSMLLLAVLLIAAQLVQAAISGVSPAFQGSPTNCTGTNYFQVVDFGTAVSWNYASAFCKSATLTGPGGCGQRGHLAQSGTAAVTGCFGTLTGFSGNPQWLGGNDKLVEGEWHWEVEDGCPGGLFWLGTSTGACQSPYTCSWNSGEPNNSGDEDCLQALSSGLWNDLPCNSAIVRYAVCEWDKNCPAGGAVAADTSVTVKPTVTAIYQFTNNDVTLTLDFGSTLQQKVFVDTNGKTGCTVVLSANTILGFGLEVYDSNGGSATNLVLQGNSGSGISHIKATTTGLTLRGSIDLTCACDQDLCGIRGTMSHGNLQFDGAIINDVSSFTTTLILVTLNDGNLVVTGGSKITVDAFHVVTSKVDAVATCSNSAITATGSTTSNYGGLTWSVVSIGIATIAGNSNSPAVNHLDFNTCNFTGPVRGYFNYFNYQNPVAGSTQALNSRFTFDHKLRVRANNDQAYKVIVDGSTLIMNGSNQYLTIGDPRDYTSGGTVSFSGATLTSSGYLEVFGKNITGVSSTVTATNSVLIKIVVAAPPP